MADDGDDRMDRRELLTQIVRGAGALAGAGFLGSLAARSDAANMVWQIDPDKCNACGNCATECVLNPSAAKVVHNYRICGYCELCFGFYIDQRAGDTETAENERCPTNAVTRTLVEPPYYQYDFDESKCVGCAQCVEGCQNFGNGALIMQVRHDRCLNCNQCAIAAACPADAFVRVPADSPYIVSDVWQGTD